ncbi:MAG: ribonuclease HII, partial [Fimbriimonadaceae bacterium]
MVDEPGVAGCDEAGRGPLAGPVVCAAVVLPAGHGIKGLGDSKALSAAARERLFDLVVARAENCIVEVSPGEIDGTNILRASLAGMSRAVAGLPRSPLRAIVDGDHAPLDMPCECEAWVKGDARHAAVAAASILAKVTRDRLMIE